MNQRRKFLLNGGMAAIAILTIDPLKSIANNLDFFPVSTGHNTNSFALAHTGSSFVNGNNQVMQRLSELDSNYSNLLILHTGHHATNTLNYPAGLNLLSGADYRIINKGKIKIGIISADEKTGTNKIANDMAIFLKKQKNCNVVVCYSHLVFKSDDQPDNLSLAAKSSHIDIIAGGRESENCKHPFIAFNKNKEEVIINHTGSDGLALYSIEIGFDKKGRKNRTKLTKLS